MPNMPPQTTPIVMIAQTNQAQDSTKKAERVLGVCEVVANEKERYPNSIDDYTVAAAAMYLVDYEHRSDITQEDERAAKTTVLSQPKHGTLKEDSALNGSYYYFPDAGYVGKDSTEVLVEIKGVKVKVSYFIHVLEYREKDAYDANCTEAPTGSTGSWKISLASNSIQSTVQIEQTGLTLRSSGTAQKRRSPLAPR
jgi:hypothetical protein